MAETTSAHHLAGSSESSLPLLRFSCMWVSLDRIFRVSWRVWVRPAYLLLVQLEGGLDEIPQGSELLLLLILSLLDLRRMNGR